MLSDAVDWRVGQGIAEVVQVTASRLGYSDAAYSSHRDAVAFTPSGIASWLMIVSRSAWMLGKSSFSTVRRAPNYSVAAHRWIQPRGAVRRRFMPIDC